MAQAEGEATRGSQAFILEQNWPNPFNAATVLRFSIPAAGHVRLGVYSCSGQRVAILVDEERQAGLHEITWRGLDADGHPVASGRYLGVLEAQGGLAASRGMTLVR